MIAVLNNWSLAKKIALSFALIGALLVGLAATGIVTNRDMTAISQRHVERGIAGTAVIGDIAEQLREQRIIVYSYYAAVDGEEMAGLEKRLAQHHARHAR